MMVIGSSATSKEKLIYHKPNCIYAKRIKTQNHISMSKERAEQQHYCACKYCSGLIGEVRTKKQKIDTWENKYKLKIIYQKNTDTLYVKTGIGFWKIFLKPGMDEFVLYHRNEFCEEMGFEEAVHGAFHKQKDVKGANEIDQLISYIIEHDRAKVTIMDDYRKLPKRTRKQKIYYRQAERRERKKAYQRLDSLFALIENQNPEIKK